MILLKISSEYLILDEAIQADIMYCLSDDLNKRNFFVTQGHIISEETISSAHKIEREGGSLLITENDLELFAEDIAQSIKLKNQQQISCRDRSNKLSTLYYQSGVKDMQLAEMIESCFKENDFHFLVEALKLEVGSFSFKVSPYQSDLIELVQIYFAQVGQLQKEAAICYFFAKKCKITHELELLEIITAYLLKSIGKSQIPLFSEEKSLDKWYQRYPFYSIHIMKKTDWDFSIDLQRYVLEQEEIQSGAGFPRGKKSEQIHFNSLLIGIIRKVFEKMNLDHYSFHDAIGYITVNEKINYPEEILGVLRSLKS